MPLPPHAPHIDGRLQLELRALAGRIRARALHFRSAVAWGLLVAAGAVLVVAGWRIDLIGRAVFPILAIATLVVGWIVSRWWRNSPLDFHAAAAVVEKDHPDLEQALRTALEQRPDANGRYHFLQRRVIDRALQHATKHDWRANKAYRQPWAALAHSAAFVAIVVVMVLSVRPPAAVVARIAPTVPGDISITPGNAEVERGSTVVIAARFDGNLPRNATLVWQALDGTAQRVPMARSLSDPVFAYTLPRVEKDVEYRVEHDGGDTEAFRLSVFDLPALVRADAALDYPEFTGLTDRRIEDTRRISAVEGTHLAYDFQFNKPVRSAVLRAADGSEVVLAPANPERTAYATAFTIEKTQRYTLHLEDDAARRNPVPADIRIEALANRRPELKIAFPRGDQRVSPIEEIRLQAEARDDFGLLDYGIAFATGIDDPHYLSLKTPDEKTLSANFEHLLALEVHGLQPDELVTWFAWADDAANDGAPRRTASDLYFAEIRPFDEIFREAGEQQQQQQQGQQGQQGGANEQLLELQRQISIAIWKIKQQRPDSSFAEDVATLAGSQARARQMLDQAAEQLREERLRAAAAQARRFMDQASDGLTKAGEAVSVDPLDDAWKGAQGAYQALLRMQPRETRVGQQRGQGGQGGNRNQRQLNQLRFRENEDNYETESQAQAMTSPEQREQLEVLSRLKELSRRQQDVNERLQQLQTALQEARDAEERERIERELKRLEEEQRRMLADLDDVRQRVERQSPSEQAQQAREQLEQTRESMRRAGEALQQGNVSQALADGTRARENLEEVSDDMRRNTSSRFAEQLRDARRDARQLSESQARTEQELNNLDENGPKALDGSAQREEIAHRLDQQRGDRERLLENLRQITEDAEATEPGLHRQLYDLLRQQGQSSADDQMQAGSQLLRRGFVDQARELQPEVTRDLDQLRRGVERAAESVLGDEASTMRFAQSELDDLSRQLDQERGPGDQSGQGQTPGDPNAPQQAGRTPGDGVWSPLAGGDGLTGEQRQQRIEQLQEELQRLREQAAQQPGANRTRGDQPGTGQESQPGIASSSQPGAQPGVGTAPDPTNPQQGPGASGQPGTEQQPGAGPDPTGNEGQLAVQREIERLEAELAQLRNAPGQGSRPGESREPGQQPGGQPGQESPQVAQQGGRQPGQQQGQGRGQNGQPSPQPGETGQQPGQQPGGQQPGQQSGEQNGGQLAQGGQPSGGQQPGGQQRGGNQGQSQQQRGGGSGGGADNNDELAEALQSFVNESGTDNGDRRAGGPLTGENFLNWSERLRTVESLLDSPEARERLAQARENAERLRAEYRRHGTPPQWGVVDDGIAAPLAEVRTWLRQELARREDPESLQPVDRDPVPERFAENVQKYYEALGR